MKCELRFKKHEQKIKDKNEAWLCCKDPVQSVLYNL